MALLVFDMLRSLKIKLIFFLPAYGKLYERSLTFDTLFCLMMFEKCF